MLVINGAYGEGGGQIVRTALTLSAMLTQPVRLENIRAGRKNPGLAAQHLTAVNAAALICEAQVSGATLGSTQLIFEPHSSPIAGIYEFDVAEAREGGSAGAAPLVLQTVLLPLAQARSSSLVTVKGGTHVDWSPSFHYFREVYLPMAARLGIQATAELIAWGWYPAGGGEIELTITGSGGHPVEQPENSAGIASERGRLKEIRGIAVASSLPAHIAQRIRNRAMNLLAEAALPAAIEPRRVRSVSPGAGIFLTAEYEGSLAGFSALGKKGKPSEQVAEEAVTALLAFHHSNAAVDVHLADQLILPLALFGPAALLATTELSQHILTNLWVVEQFLGPVAEVDRRRKLVRFLPAAARPGWQ